MESEMYDVAIIGAGPAGCASALAIGKSDLKVVMIDKSEFPRDKVCGDGLVPYVPKVLKSLSEELYHDFMGFASKQHVKEMRLISPNGKSADFPTYEPMFACKRTVLDNYLLEKARELSNVETQLNNPVKNIEKIEGGYKVSTQNAEIKTKLLIACDGAQGVTRRKTIPVPKDAGHTAGAVKIYYKGLNHSSETMTFFFPKKYPQGYFWVFPLPNGEFNVGFGMKSSSISESKVNLKKAIFELIENDPAISNMFDRAEKLTEVEGYGLPLGSRKVPLSGERLMFCGDAGHLIEPLTGEGIGQALVSGRYAGWHAKKCFEDNDFSAEYMKAYDKTVYDKLWNDHEKRYKAGELISKRPFVMNFLVYLIRKNKRFRNSIMKPKAS